MIEVLKQAIDYIENVPDDRDGVGHIDRHALVAALKARLAQPEQEPMMMEIFWDGEEAGVKLTQGFIDSHKVLQLDVLIDAKAEIERIYEELLGAKE